VCVGVHVCVHVFMCVCTYVHECVFVCHSTTQCLTNVSESCCSPPKNGEIALWPNTRAVKYKFQSSMFHKRQTSTIISAMGTIFGKLLIA